MTTIRGEQSRNKNVTVTKKQNEAEHANQTDRREPEPQVGELWVDSSGTVYLLHYARVTTGKEEVYQLTQLDNGAIKGTSISKTHLVSLFNMHLCSCPVEIKNKSAEDGGGKHFKENVSKKYGPAWQIYCIHAERLQAIEQSQHKAEERMLARMKSLATEVEQLREQVVGLEQRESRQAEKAAQADVSAEEALATLSSEVGEDRTRLILAKGLVSLTRSLQSDLRRIHLLMLAPTASNPGAKTYPAQAGPKWSSRYEGDDPQCESA